MTQDQDYVPTKRELRLMALVALIEVYQYQVTDEYASEQWVGQTFWLLALRELGFVKRAAATYRGREVKAIKLHPAAFALGTITEAIWFIVLSASGTSDKQAKLTLLGKQDLETWD